MIRIATLLSGHGASAAFMLLRNLALARLLGLEEYGLAISLSILLAAVEMTTSLGLPQLCVSHVRGARTRFQAALHGAQILRGLVGAVLLLVLSAPLAAALGAQDQLILFQMSAVVPVLLGFCHLDPFRAQRLRRHRPHMLLLAVPAAASLLALWPVSRIIAGPEVMLALLVLHAALTCAMSHLLAGRKYRIKLDCAILALALRYGLPVAANGVLMFAVIHLEKLIAGQALGVAALALVGMGATLTLTPALILARSFQAYHLPLLKTGIGDAGTRTLSFGCLIGAGVAVGTAFAAPLVLPLLGLGFSPLLPLIPPFAVLGALRLPKSAMATLALAQARTGLPTLANLPRLLMAPVIWWSLTNGGGLDGMLALALLAEICGLAVGLFLLRGTARLPVLPLLTFVVCCGLVMLERADIAAVTWLGLWMLTRARLAAPKVRAA